MHSLREPNLSAGGGPCAMRSVRTGAGFARASQERGNGPLSAIAHGYTYLHCRLPEYIVGFLPLRRYRLYADGVFLQCR
jgi:hypothetical protein